MNRRGDGEYDEGWNTVKPRKSFGAEGAERFSGKMGGNYKDEKRPVRDDRTGARGKTADGDDGPQRNGLGRTRTDGADAPAGDRNRMKSWRDREAEKSASDDRRRGNNDSRWGRDGRDGRDGRRDQRDLDERDPEWFDEPVTGRHEAHTQQDFQKWMEQMKKAKNAAAGGDEALEAKQPTKAAPAVDAGPDKFFMAFGGGGSGAEAKEQPEQTETPSKAKGGAGKSSRFTSFFSGSQEDPRGKMESVTPVSAPQQPSVNGLAALLGSMPPAGSHTPDNEKQAFQQLLAKLQNQTMSATPPGMSLFAPPPEGKQQQASPGPQQNQQRGPPPPGFPRPQKPPTPQQQPPQQQIHAPRPQQNARPEQLLEELVSQHQRKTSQGPAPAPATREKESASARNNSNTEFLMNLMRAAPKPQGAPDGQNRSGPPPGFSMEELLRGPGPRGEDGRSGQPTQILQRPPPPPGLDQMPPGFFNGPPPRGPPGMAGGPCPGPGGPNRNMPMPPMFPPNFPPGPPPPDGMTGMPPPRNMPMPPPGFFGGPPPPHGFAPPGFAPPGPGHDPRGPFPPRQ